MRVLGWIFLGLLIVGALAGGLYGKARYDGLVAESARDRARIAELEEKVASASSEREAAEKRVAVANDELEAMRSQVAQLAEQRAEAERRRAQHDALATALQPMVDGKKLEVGRRGGRMTMNLPAQRLFGRGSADLSPAGKQTLTALAEHLKKQDLGRMMVAGHTDDLPIGGDKFRSNWDLSSAYAATVAQFLIAAGVDAKKLLAVGFAENDPVGDNKTAAGQQANRRVELVLLPPEAPLVAPEAAAAPAPVPGATSPSAPASAPASPSAAAPSAPAPSPR